MRKWEDIIKEKVEEPEGALPESVYAEFQARRSAAAAAPSPKRFPLVWVVAPAVAAGLSAILLLHRPSVPENGIQVIDQPSVPMAVVTDTTTVMQPEQTEPLIVRPKREVIQQPVKEEPTPQEVACQPEEEEPEAEQLQPEVEQHQQEEVHRPEELSSSPFIPQELKKPRSVMIKVAPAAGIIAGGGLLAAVILPSLGARRSDTAAAPVYEEDHYTGAPDTAADPGSDPGPSYHGLVEDPVHRFPLKVGLSTRIPVTEGLFISTGLDYSFYRSTFTYAITGEKKQNAHYLGIPIKINWSIASNRLFDVYVGGGLEGDFCVAADLGGNKVAKDGFGLSLQAAGGVQMNFTKRLGIYVEPGLNWQVPLNTAVLSTYRTEHPFMFSVSAGLRFNIK